MFIMVHVSWTKQKVANLEVWNFQGELDVHGRSEFQGSATIWRCWGNSTGGMLFEFADCEGITKDEIVASQSDTHTHTYMLIQYKHGSKYTDTL